VLQPRPFGGVGDGVLQVDMRTITSPLTGEVIIDIAVRRSQFKKFTNAS
jgi:hypothetical protein